MRTSPSFGSTRAVAEAAHCATGAESACAVLATPENSVSLFEIAFTANPPTNARPAATRMVESVGSIFLSMQLSPLRQIRDFGGIYAFRPALFADDLAVFDAHDTVGVTQGSRVVRYGEHAAILLLGNS